MREIVFIVFCSIIASDVRAAPAYTCHRSLRAQNAMTGVLDAHIARRGLETREFPGYLLLTRSMSSKDGCFFPGLASAQCVVMQFPVEALAKVSLVGQCAYADTGEEFRHGDIPRGTGRFNPEQIFVGCPHPSGYPCAPGFGDSLDDTYARAKANLDARGVALWSWCVPKALTKLNRSIGKRIFCQLYDPGTGTVAFATEFTLAP